MQPKGKTYKPYEKVCFAYLLSNYKNLSTIMESFLSVLFLGNF